MSYQNAMKQIKKERLDQRLSEEKEKEKKLTSELKEEEKSEEKDIFLLDEEYTELLELDLSTEFTTHEVSFSIRETEDIELLESIEHEVLSSDFDTTFEETSPEFGEVETNDILLMEWEPAEIEGDYETRFEEVHPVFETYKTEDIKLSEEEEVEEMEADLSTEIGELEVESLETLAEDFSGSLLEDLLEEEERKKRSPFPTSFGQGLSSPVIVILEEDEKDFHTPFLYLLKELYREVEEDYPRIVYRIPETSEEAEMGDSFVPHHLDTLDLEREIEVLYLKDWMYPLGNFINYVKGRLKTAFLKRLGFLVVVVKRGEGRKVEEKISEVAKGIRIYRIYIRDENYDRFCSLITGVKEGGDFTNRLMKYNTALERTVRNFSVYVARDKELKDKHQYPYKVATFVCLANRLIENKEDFRKEILKKLRESKENKEESIKVEEERDCSNTKVISDIVYRKNTAVEIETLISSIEPMKKIDETVLKYEDCGEVEKIWIVLRPVSAFLHYGELVRRKEILKEMVSKEVEFKVLVLKKRGVWNLVDLEVWRRGHKGKDQRVEEQTQ